MATPAILFIGVLLSFYHSWNETRLIGKEPQKYLAVASALTLQQQGTTETIRLSDRDRNLPPVFEELEAMDAWVYDLREYKSATYPGLFEDKYAVKVGTSAGFIYRGYYFAPDLTEEELTLMEQKKPRGNKDGSWKRIHPQIFKYTFGN